MKRWSLEETARAIGEIADAEPDHVDENVTGPSGCQYIGNHGHPLCIVGVFLVNKVGLDVKRVEKLDTMDNGKSIPIRRVGWMFQDCLTPDALDYLDVVQNSQDEGSTWGHARECADAAFIPNDV